MPRLAPTAAALAATLSPEHRGLVTFEVTVATRTYAIDIQVLATDPAERHTFLVRSIHRAVAMGTRGELLVPVQIQSTAGIEAVQALVANNLALDSLGEFGDALATAAATTPFHEDGTPRAAFWDTLDDLDEAGEPHQARPPQ